MANASKMVLKNDPFVLARMSTAKKPKAWLMPVLISSAALFTGCSDRIGEAERQMVEIRNSPAQLIQDPPKIEQVEDFVYSAGNLRSPFMPPSLLNSAKTQVSEEGVRPDINRTKEPLEQYELAELVYRGIVISPEGKQYGLVQRPDGSVASVEVGNYLGTNEGRIVEITPTQINLIEIIPDSRVGFVEKPESLVSPAG